MRIAAVIFDCDGTLVDSETLGLRVIAREARALGVPLDSDDALLAWKGRPMAQSLRALEQALGRPLPPDYEATLRTAMAQTFREQLQPIAGAAAMLGSLHLPFCVATNGPRAKTELTLGLTGLLPHFTADRIFSAYDLNTWKPDPGLFLHAARAMGTAPEHCAVVEDSEPGVRAGLAAGMRVFVLRSAHPLPDELAGRVSFLERLADLGAALREASALP
jgi:HAD superfamily hydrolase (TIGR01509 family)